MSDGKKFDVERPFVVDGIKEYDNPLPSWFIILFLGTILFSVCYLVYYGAMGGASLEQEFTTDEKRYEQKQAQLAAQDSSSNLGEEIKDPAMIAAGKEIYTANCAPCHGPQGQGVVGPNLTDKYWIHGGSPQDIVNVIVNGVPDKGMVSWKTILGRKKIKQVTAYVVSIGGSNPPNPKAPQGEVYEGQ